MNILLVGGGKLAGKIVSLFRDAYDFIGYIDDVYSEAYVGKAYNLRRLGGSSDLASLRSICDNAIVTIGSEGNTTPRRDYFAKLESAGFTLPTLIHPTAYVSPQSTIARGCIIQVNAFVGPGTSIGANSILSTHAVLEHDSILGEHVYMAPGSVICGSVTVGDGTFIGAGATVIQKITIGAGCVIAAGACVVRDVPASVRVAGVPARPMG